jgi:hypothetical protein
MSLTVSTPVKILALAGVLGAVALGAGFMLLGKTAGTSSTPAVIKPLHPRHQALHTPTPPAVKAHHTAPVHATHRSRAAVAHKSPAAPAKHRPATVKPKPKAVAIAPLPKNGLPAVINRALQSHAVVVVSLYDPQADVDAASVGEASAGAKLAGAGFVPLNVLSQAQASPLARKLGVLPDPALLIFRAPDQLVFRVDGFADRDTVAQAVANALPADPTNAGWRIQANQICAAAGTDPAQLNQLRGLDVPAASRAAFDSFVNRYAKLLTGPASGKAAATRSVASSGTALGLTDCTGKPRP